MDSTLKPTLKELQVEALAIRIGSQAAFNRGQALTDAEMTKLFNDTHVYWQDWLFRTGRGGNA